MPSGPLLLQMQLEPLSTFRQGTNRIYRLQQGEHCLLAKRYVGLDARQRRDREKKTLQLWRTAGFSVPSVKNINLAELGAEPYLIVEYVSPLTLQEWLQSKDVPWPQKLEQIERIYQENQRRHHRAIQDQEKCLVHADPNTSNVLLKDGRHCFIDFETVPGAGAIQELAALETAKLTRWIVRDCGRQFLAEITDCLMKVYGTDDGILETIVNRTRGRPCQWYHRWVDRNRRKQNPSEVTKYDIADTLAERISAHVASS